MKTDANTTDIKTSARDAIATFVTAAAVIVVAAYCFTIRGDCKLGQCLVTMLTIEEYTALLLAVLVTMKKKSALGAI